jgi:hypothetical protein
MDTTKIEILEKLDLLSEPALAQVLNLVENLSHQPPETELEPTDWDSLNQVLEKCKLETGIDDLADQHDYYLYGTPKRDPISE